MIKIIYFNTHTNEQVEVWVERDLLGSVVEALIRAGCNIIEIRNAP